MDLTGGKEVLACSRTGVRGKNLSQNSQKSGIIRDMGKKIIATAKSDKTRVLGPKVFAAIAAVEGLHLTAASKKRLAVLRGSNMTPDQQRAEIMRAYAPAKVRR